MRKHSLKLVTPTTLNGSVVSNPPPRRLPNSEVRSREYLTEAETEQLIAAAGANRHGHRDATMIVVARRLNNDWRRAGR